MPFFNTVAVVLIAAIANPLCCCLADVTVDSEPIPAKQLPVDHICCLASQGDESQQQSPEEHTPSDCPHQIEKDSQIRQIDSGDSLAKPVFFVAKPLSANIFESDFKILSKTAIPDRTTEVRSRSIQVAQSYCVYLL